ISKHGIPTDIVSDRATIFTARFMKAFTEGLGIKQNMSTAFHPQTDGQTERTNSTLEQYLRCYLNHQQDNWKQLLPLAEFTYNNTKHTATNESPFYAVFGYHPHFNANLPRVNANVPLATERLNNLRDVQEDLKFFIKNAQLSYEEYYNRKV